MYVRVSKRTLLHVCGEVLVDSVTCMWGGLSRFCYID